MKDVIAAVEKHTQLILDAENYIWQHAETGFKEYETTAYMAEQFQKLGYTDLVMAEGITGFYTVVDTGRPGPVVLVLGELDALVCFEHKEANPKTGAVHACGHHAQCAALLGVAAALKEPGILDRLCGKIKLCAVPAEENIEMEYRTRLKEEGKIRYFSGKNEFLYRGYFDDVDMALLVHTAGEYNTLLGGVGYIAKQVIYKGVAAHAGGSPHEGKNALYAATLGLQAVNAIRETFQESDMIRVHPIMSAGGTLVNTIPDRAVLESYVRGANIEAILRENQKVNQALTGAALSVGTNIEIIDMLGYSPYFNDCNLTEIAKEAVACVIPEYEFHSFQRMGTGSSDMGDLCSVMPAIQLYAAGGSGRMHGDDFRIADPVAACVGSAKLQLGMLMVLLEEYGIRAKKVLEDYKPIFPSKKAFFAYRDSIHSSGDRICYNRENAVVSVDVR